jgi:hypothetical protein
VNVPVSRDRAMCWTYAELVFGLRVTVAGE